MSLHWMLAYISKCNLARNHSESIRKSERIFEPVINS